jgi:predicted HicB family RNase H-like nuclease
MLHGMSDTPKKRSHDENHTERFNILLTPRQRRILAAAAARERVSMAQLIRQMICSLPEA